MSVMEVRSESDRLSKLKKKMKGAWMENGVRLAWLIDPKTEKVWIYRQDGSEDEVVGFDKVFSGESFEFDLGVGRKVWEGVGWGNVV